MKKLNILFLCALICFSLSACNKDTAPDTAEVSSDISSTVSDVTSEQTSADVSSEGSSSEDDDSSAASSKKSTSSKTSSKKATSSKASSSKASSSKADSSSAASSESTYLTLDEYLKANKEEVDRDCSEAETDEISIRAYAKGNSLVYSYTFKSEIEDRELLKKSLDEGLAGITGTASDILKSLRKEVPSAESIIFEYLDKDGNLITSREYK